ncbi:MAG: SDR family oxidoreductase [Thermoanaerobaculia bacterium]
MRRGTTSRRLFARRTALVTGGARRLGLAIARELAREGAAVVFTFNSTPRAEVRKVSAELLEAGAAEVRAHRCNLADPEELRKLVGKLRREPIDYLVNSAANFLREDFFDATLESWSETMSVNLRAPFFLSQAVAEGMKKNGFGRIVNIADVAGVIPWKSHLAYSISKAGLIAMTRGLAKALAPEILVNAVSPGPVLLPESFGATESRNAVEPTLLKRAGAPEEVAAAVTFLLQSDYITGITLPVDGGRLLR